MSSIELSEVIRNYAIVIGGVIALGLAVWRGIALSRQSRAQERQARIAQRAHVTEVFKDAVEQLGNEKLEVRLGAVLTLKRIADDFPELDGPIVELLTAYVRESSRKLEQDEEPAVDIIEIVKFIQRAPRVD